jgi:HprK-related kinase A
MTAGMIDALVPTKLTDRPILEVGPHRFHVTTPVATLERELLDLYAEYPWHDTSHIADFHVGVRPPSLLRRFVRTNVIGETDLQAPFVPLPTSHALVAMEMALNWTTALCSLRFLTLHASGVERDGVSIIMPGESGSGKSTLAAGLGYRGWRFLSDEFALLDPDTLAHHAYPRPTSLKNDAIPVMKSWIDAARFSKPFPGTQKGEICYLRPEINSLARMHETAVPKLIVFPAFSRDYPPELAPMTPSEAMVRMVAGSANYDKLGERGFECLTKLVAQCPAYWLSYRNFDEADELLSGALRG